MNIIWLRNMGVSLLFFFKIVSIWFQALVCTIQRSFNIRTQPYSRWWCILRVLLLNNQFRLTIRKQIEEAIRFCYVFTNHQMKWQAFPLQTSNSANCIVTWIWYYLALTSIATSKVLMNLYLPRSHAISDLARYEYCKTCTI